MKILLYLSAAAPLFIVACTHDVMVASTSMPAGEVMANRVIQTPTIYAFSSDIRDSKPTITFDGLACSAHSYNLNIGSAIYETLSKATQAGFAHASEGGSTTRSGYNIRFDLDEISGRLNVIPGFLSSKIDARVEIAARVDVTDSQGTEVARAVLEGESTAVRDGGCFNANVALQAASEKAVRRLATDYVYKVINTNVLR